MKENDIIESLSVDLVKIFRQIHDLKPLTDEGITHQQFIILLVLLSEGRMPLSRLAERFKLTRATITINIDRMEKAGLVRRIKDLDDKRVVYAEATAKAERKVEQFRALRRKKIVHSLECLSQEEVFTLSAILHKVADNFEM